MGVILHRKSMIYRRKVLAHLRGTDADGGEGGVGKILQMSFCNSLTYG